MIFLSEKMQYNEIDLFFVKKFKTKSNTYIIHIYFNAFSILIFNLCNQVKKIVS